MKNILYIICIFLVQYCYSQSDTSLSNSFKTKVFVLNTCKPDQLSIETIKDRTSKSKLQNNQSRLEVNVKDFSAFRIENINPLRYNYYINDELVTQFMTEAAQTTVNDIFKNGNILEIKDIKNVEIFSIDWDKVSDSRKFIVDQENKINNFKDSIAKAENVLKLSYDALNEIDSFDYTKNKWVVKKKPKYKYDSLSEVRQNDALNKEEIVLNLTDNLLTMLVTFEKELNNLGNNANPFSNNNPFLDYTRNKYSCMDRAIAVVDTEQYKIIDKIDSFNNSSKRFKDSAAKIQKLLIIDLRRTIPTNSNLNDADSNKKNRHNILKQINDLLLPYGYSIYYNEDPPIDKGSITNSATYKENYTNYCTSIIEFLSYKKIQDYESFLVTTSAAMGKLLQNKFIEYSQSLNSYYHRNCLDTEALRNIYTIRQNLTCNFKLIQDLSADFAVAVNYLGVNNSEFKSIVTNINKYYSGLLEFLKYLDHLETNNTIEYTLPNHNNLKNVDFVRYKIERDDQLTKASQTYEYDIWIQGGLKIDFSAGVFTTGVTDFSYSKTPVYKNDKITPTTDSLYITQKNEGKVNFAFGGMVNISPRLGASWLTPGVSFGVAYTNSQKLQYLCGIAFHMGKTERLIVHAGFAGGMATRLDKSQLTIYEETEKDKKFMVNGSMNNFNIPTVERFVGKPFFGLTYNLSKTSKFQDVTDAGYKKNSSSGK